jgi:hypothetical protein
MNEDENGAAREQEPPECDAKANESRPKADESAPKADESRPKADETAPGANAVERKPARHAAGNERLAREQDARTLTEELGKGLSMMEIRAKYGWSRSAYYRRVRLAENLAKEEYDNERAYLIFLKHEARIRRLQREAEARVEDIKRRLQQLAQNCNDADAREVAALNNTLVKMLKFIGQCEEMIFKSAEILGIMPSQAEPAPEPTLDQLIKASIEEYGEEAHELPDPPNPWPSNPEPPNPEPPNPGLASPDGQK